MVRGAVASTIGDEHVVIVDDLTIGDPGPGEVRLRVHAAGICHSDISGMNGTIRQHAPFVPGHEGAGEVVAVGDGVTSVKPGDHAIVAWSAPCGTCTACLRGQPNLCLTVFTSVAFGPRFHRDGQDVFGFAGTGTWAEEMLLPEQAVIPIPADVPYEIGALIGCGVTTGVGAVVNRAKVVPGSSVVVFGLGGVGVAAVQGARLCGAAEIVAVDRVLDKLDDARRFGATHAVHPDDLDAVKAKVTDGGFDYAIECVGSAATFRAAWDATRRGGTTVIVGAGSKDAVLALTGVEMFVSEKALLGSYYGSADVRTEFHRLIRLWQAGRLDLEGMVSRHVGLDGINEGIQALKNGEVIRQVIDLAP